ncbi:MAG: hypothetical protein NVS4B11_32410 [Ktedonobacteraceae bacterium]
MPNAEKILANIKGLRAHLRPEEEPLVSLPGIWDSIPTEESERRATTCEIVLTNQRLLGYMHTKFPREKLFLETFSLTGIIHLSLREKSFDPIFRELLVSDGLHKTYIRSSRQKIEMLYQELQAAIETYAPHNTISAIQSSAEVSEEKMARRAPVYERKAIRTTFEQSHLGITVLFVGGLLLEIIGILVWSLTKSGQIGLPLCAAGFFAIFIATLTRRQRS